jgi:hypothetical protein
VAVRARNNNQKKKTHAAAWLAGKADAAGSEMFGADVAGIFAPAGAAAADLLRSTNRPSCCRCRGSTDQSQYSPFSIPDSKVPESMRPIVVVND